MSRGEVGCPRSFEEIGSRLMNSQYFDAMQSLKRFHYVSTRRNIEECPVMGALLKYFSLVSIEVKGGWHGDSFRDIQVYVMSSVEADEIERVVLESYK